MDEVKIEKLHTDVRGSIFSLKISGKEFILVTSVKGAPRGGHYHEDDRIHFVLDGSYDYRELDLKTDKETKRILKPGDGYNVKAGTPHLLTALEDSIFLETVSKGNTVNYPPYRKIVETFIKEKSA